jgi:hypothetical protein
MNSELIRSIVREEWEQFQRVQNQGGRAPCQNDYRTFAIMRASQFSTWNDGLCESYLADLRGAAAGGRNLLTEKYAYMMKSTDPAGFENIRHLLPPVSREKADMIDGITAVQLGWQSEYVKKYPRFSAGSRPTDASSDSLYGTSFETYLRGELATYSERTLALYLAHVKALEAAGRNMTIENLECTARMYGFASLAEMEKISG